MRKWDISAARHPRHPGSRQAAGAHTASRPPAASATPYGTPRAGANHASTRGARPAAMQTAPTAKPPTPIANATGHACAGPAHRNTTAASLTSPPAIQPARNIAAPSANAAAPSAACDAKPPSPGAPASACAAYSAPTSATAKVASRRVRRSASASDASVQLATSLSGRIMGVREIGKSGRRATAGATGRSSSMAVGLYARHLGDHVLEQFRQAGAAAENGARCSDRHHHDAGQHRIFERTDPALVAPKRLDETQHESLLIERLLNGAP
ncbi:hypothetical protein Y033_5862 [Burkholderia pseudomallei MSHR435]|nr:hypothetical protein Y033_5862 [Burkholderia pseudomallei MSHR435]